MRILINFFIPGSALISGALFFLKTPYLHQVTRLQVDLGAVIILFLCTLLAWRFDRSRVIYALQVLFYADIGIHYLKVSTHSNSSTFITAVLFVNLIFVSLLRERGIHSLRGLLVLCLPIIQAAGLFYFWSELAQAPLIPYFGSSYVNLPSVLSTIPDLILLLIVITLLVQTIRFLRYPNPLEGALFWAIFAVAAALFFPIGIHTTILLTAAVLAILISFIESAYTLAYRDELTGVPGRRAMLEAFKKLGNRYSIAMVDIDFFKKFNDKYGHDIGDQVLKMVASRLAKCSGGGRAFRYGGEEFCVIFTGKNIEECLEHLEDLRASIGEQPFTIRKITRPLKKPKKKAIKKIKQNAVTVTVSIGVAEKTALYNQPDIVMKRADQALYRAKEAGRNQVRR